MSSGVVPENGFVMFDLSSFFFFAWGWRFAPCTSAPLFPLRPKEIPKGQKHDKRVESGKQDCRHYL